VTPARRAAEGSRELLILRHAKSDRGGFAGPDFDRPLDDRGREDAPRVGKWLRKKDLVPDHVVASPARRARDTAEAVAAAAGIEPAAIAWEKGIYDASLGALLRVLAEVPPGARRILLVGHNPGLEELVLHLAAGDVPMPEDGKLLVTSALARFDLPPAGEPLAEGCGVLRGIRRPG
jgi:phosphohistidine phosphatase